MKIKLREDILYNPRIVGAIALAMAIGYTIAAITFLLLGIFRHPAFYSGIPIFALLGFNTWRFYFKLRKLRDMFGNISRMFKKE